jgi:ribose 5-phosphate isomerase B
MNIYAGSDHAGFNLKKTLIGKLQELGFEVKDLGTDSKDSCDYPDYAHLVAQSVLKDKNSLGLIVCGSGIGISMAANRHSGIRAALCRSGFEAELARKHNNANVLALGERITGQDLALDILDKFINTDFEGGRHSRRVEKIEIK